MNKLILLVILGFYIEGYASCTKSEILKLIDKKYSKNEIDNICNQAEEPKWMTPGNFTCRFYGGSISEKTGQCIANWESAKRICRKSDGRLPSIYELKVAAKNCGANDVNNPAYQACYQSKGFSKENDYWSSSKYKEEEGNLNNGGDVLVMNFESAIPIGRYTGSRYLDYVICVK